MPTEAEQLIRRLRAFGDGVITKLTRMDALEAANRLQSANAPSATAKKHPDCEDRCQLKEHKGYDDCNHTGVCAYAATLTEAPQPGFHIGEPEDHVDATLPPPATQRSDLADIKELAMFWSRMPSGATDVLSNAGACRLARAYLDALDVINATPLSETPPSGTANDLVAPRGHDEAHARINQCFREIEIICDTFGYDPAQWLVIDDGDMASMQPSNNGSTT